MSASRTYALRSAHHAGVREGPLVRENHFGTVEVDWAARELTLGLVAMRKVGQACLPTSDCEPTPPRDSPPWVGREALGAGRLVCFTGLKREAP